MPASLPALWRRTGDATFDGVTRIDWTAIRTYHTRRTVVDLVNVWTWNERDIRAGRAADARTTLARAWHDIDVRAKFDCSTSCVLEHKTSGELRYFKSSNNTSLLPAPWVVSSLDDLRRIYDGIASVDLVEGMTLHRPSAAWRLRLITNLTFYVYKMLGLRRIGSPVRLPLYLHSNRYVL